MQDLKRLFTYFGKYKKDIVIGGLLVVCESFFELLIPVLMADLIDTGVMQKDMSYIFYKGAQMGVCALLSLITGLLYARFAARAAYGSAQMCVTRNTRAFRSMPFQTWTVLRHPRLSRV